MVFLRENGSQQSSRNIYLWSAVYNSVMKLTVIPIQEMKIEFMMILQQKKVKLEKDAITRRNHYPSSGIYLTDAKLAQCTLVAENRREKE